LSERRIALFGCVAVVNPTNTASTLNLDCSFWGGFATQRGQAPSPQRLFATNQASAVSITIIKQNPISSPRLASWS
jgi:hypothetical protein